MNTLVALLSCLIVVYAAPIELNFDIGARKPCKVGALNDVGRVNALGPYVAIMVEKSFKKEDFVIAFTASRTFPKGMRKCGVHFDIGVFNYEKAIIVNLEDSPQTETVAVATSCLLANFDISALIYQGAATLLPGTRDQKLGDILVADKFARFDHMAVYQANGEGANTQLPLEGEAMSPISRTEPGLTFDRGTPFGNYWPQRMMVDDEAVFFQSRKFSANSIAAVETALLYSCPFKSTQACAPSPPNVHTTGVMLSGASKLAGTTTFATFLGTFGAAADTSSGSAMQIAAANDVPAMSIQALGPASSHDQQVLNVENSYLVLEYAIQGLFAKGD